VAVNLDARVALLLLCGDAFVARPDRGLLAVVELRPPVKQRRSRDVRPTKEASELQAKLDGGGLSPDEQQKATAELKNKRKAIEEQVAYDAYAKDTLLRLANDGITYTEQSNSLKKMAQRFDPEQIESLKKQLIAEHPELAAQISALEVKHLVMITTNEFGPRDQRLDQRDQKSAGRKNKRDFTDQIQPIIEQVRRGDTTGVDIAGAEFYTFDAEGQRRMQHLYGRLLGEAMESGKVIVLRPHVGEGANDTEHGKHYNRDGDRQLVDGEASHYSRAKANLDAMLTAFEGIARAMGSEQLPPEVVVRFGHATHTTPEQAVRMAKLGIIAEVNLASNVQTDSLNQGKIENGTDQHRGTESILSPHDASARGHGNMDDHALATLVAEGVPIILSTDAHSVMSTDMKDQYDRANQIVREVIAGSRTVKIKTEHGTVEQSYEEMSPELKQRFNEAERKFYEDANAYYEKQKGVTREGQPSESEPQA